MRKIGWYARRLRTMQPAEVAWRASRVASTVARTSARHDSARDSAILASGEHSWPSLLERFHAGTGRPVLLDPARASTVADAAPDEVAALVRAADQVLIGRFTFFGYPEATCPDPLDWHLDPLSGARWPAIPSARINHRVTAGDPKWIWELNRLQHLPWLAEAWLFTGEPRYAEGALDQLDSWIAQNPPGVGIAWRGAFEAGIRAISVAIALQGLRGSAALTPERYRRAVRMLAQSAHRCWNERSRFSSANNHLVGELAGLATVAILFPELRNAGSWRAPVPCASWPPRPTARSCPTAQGPSRRSATRSSQRTCCSWSPCCCSARVRSSPRPSGVRCDAVRTTSERWSARATRRRGTATTTRASRCDSARSHCGSCATTWLRSPR